MLRLLLLSFGLLVCSMNIVQAQTCMPDSTFQDSTGFVYPPPYDEEASPEGGIDVAACINTPYEFVWQVITPPTVEILGLNLNLAHLKLNTTGAIKNLPEGITYVCNPPDCQFNVGQVGCVMLVGMPSANNAPGNYDLEFEGVLRLAVGANFPVTFPDEGIFPGKYTLAVYPEGDPACQPTSLNDERRDVFTHSIYPNPTLGEAWLQLFAVRESPVVIDVFDMGGRLHRTATLMVLPGENNLLLETQGLDAGYYIYRLTWPDGQRASGSFVKASR
jgi:hypothetical protein